MTIFNTLISDPQLPVLISLLLISLLSLGTSLTALFLERQSSQKLQARLRDLSQTLIEQQEDYNKLEQLQKSSDQRHHHMDQVVDDVYGLIQSNTQQLERIKDTPTPNHTLLTEALSISHYDQAIKMAKEGMSGEQIKKICGLTEGEVNLILDLHQ